MAVTEREMELMEEVQKLKAENRRLKEDKAENEARYERLIKYYKERLRGILETPINDRPAHKATFIDMDDIKIGDALREDIPKVDAEALNRLNEEIKRRFV